jgi:hypothetical protein
MPAYSIGAGWKRTFEPDDDNLLIGRITGRRRNRSSVELMI